MLPLPFTKASLNSDSYTMFLKGPEVSLRYCSQSIDLEHHFLCKAYTHTHARMLSLSLSPHQPFTLSRIGGRWWGKKHRNVECVSPSRQQLHWQNRSYIIILELGCLLKAYNFHKNAWMVNEVNFGQGQLFTQ